MAPYSGVLLKAPEQFYIMNTDTLQSAIAVSYTHLDVYKRQAGGREVAGSNPVAPIEPERLRQKFTLDKEQWTC